MKKIIFLLPLIVLIGCVQANLSDDVCDTRTLGTIPASPVSGITLPPTTFPPVSFDFSATLNKIDSITDQLDANVSRFMISNNSGLNWLKEVSVSIAGNTADTPEALFASYHYAGTDPGDKISIDVQMDSGTLLRYLSAPITLTFTMAGTAPTTPVKLMNMLCLSVAGKFNKSL
jgi:hypothetical protein